jgi:nucleoside-diphosphate-sugar epimerase
MRILITGGTSRFSQSLAKLLGTGHDIELTGAEPASAEQAPISFCSLDDVNAIRPLLRGVEAVVHPGAVARELSDSDKLDYATRRTYNLLWASAEEGVPRCIFVSSLGVMRMYPANFAIRESWRPMPGSDTSALCYHLGEVICREFVRDQLLDVICLRLADLAWGSADSGTEALPVTDAVRAVELALTVDARAGIVPTDVRFSGPQPRRKGWGVFHIPAQASTARFPTFHAHDVLGFSPTAHEEGPK